MAVLRFSLSVIRDSTINGKAVGTGQLVIEDIGSSISIKTLLHTTPICKLSEIKEFTPNKKSMELETIHGDKVVLYADKKNIEMLSDYFKKSGLADKMVMPVVDHVPFYKSKVFAGFVAMIILGAIGNLKKKDEAPLYQSPVQSSGNVGFNENTGQRERVPASFNEEKVKAKSEVAELSKGGKIRVAFVDEKSPNLKVEAKNCVSHYLKSYKAVQCFAFRTQKAFEMAQVDTQKQLSMKNLCYSVAVSKIYDSAWRTDELSKQEQALEKCR